MEQEEKKSEPVEPESAPAVPPAEEPARAVEPHPAEVDAAPAFSEGGVAPEAAAVEAHPAAPVETASSSASLTAPEGVRPAETEPVPLTSPETLPAAGADPFRPLESAPASPVASAEAAAPVPAAEIPAASPVSRLESQEAVTPPAEPAPEPPALSGPNWMLAFVCAWAGATALNEAWAVMAPIGFKLPLLLRNTAFVGYTLLGLGLAAFAIEALRWGARKREGGSLAQVLLPAVVTLAGVIALILSQDPGRRI